MNQNNSPSLADCVGPCVKVGTFPVPCPLSPWHFEQFVSKSCLAFAGAPPLNGFFIAFAEGGALWNKRLCAEAVSRFPVAKKETKPTEIA
jgi:hypothetical protein